MEPKEDSDLLRGNKPILMKPSRNGGGDSTDREPPDGGFRAYCVLVASFFTNGLLFGVINSCSVFYKVLVDQLKEDNIPNPDSRAALVGSLAMGTTFLLSPLSSLLTGLMGLRLTAVLGGSIAATGLLISSFVTRHVDALVFTYGIMYGLGASLAYTPSLAILGHYFKRHLGIVNGVVTIGSSVFTVIMSMVMDYMILNHGLDWMFKLLALFTVGIALCGLIFKPTHLIIIEKSSADDDGFKTLMKKVLDTQIWKNKKYTLWASSMPVALFGYLVPYVYIKKFTSVNFKGVAYENLPLYCMATGSGIGRLIFGFLGDLKGMDRILLQQISFYIIGTFTIILPFVGSFALNVAISFGMGIFDGAFIALIGPIAFELCGSTYAAQGIGNMLGLAALPLSIGPLIAGKLYSYYNSYTLPYVLAGISPLIGATLMFTVRFRKQEYKDPSESAPNGHISLIAADPEKATEPVQSNGEFRRQTTL